MWGDDYSLYCNVWYVIRIGISLSVISEGRWGNKFARLVKNTKISTQDVEILLFNIFDGSKLTF